MAVGSKTAKMITMAKYARRCGISRQAVSKMALAGTIPVHGERRLIDPVEADLARDAARTRVKMANGEANASSLKHRKARAAREESNAKLAQLEYEIAVKRVLPKASVERAMVEASRVIARQIDGLVAEVDNIEAAYRDNGTRGIRLHLKKCVRDMRQGIADELTETADKIMKAGGNDG